jgi:hypothetical protein
MLDSVAFATKNGVALNGSVIAATLVGCVLQHRISLWDDAGDAGDEEKPKKKKKKKKKDDEEEDEDEEDDPPKSSAWKRLLGG